MRVLVIANPRATTTTPRQRDVLVHALSADAKLEIEETANRGHAAALACRAMRDGVDAVVALGGDGTVNEVVNGLLTDGVHPDVPALGVVPGGSTNVFARALGLPQDPVEATSVLIDAMGAGRTRRIGLGLADERWFLFTAGLGYDAAVVAAVEAHRRRGKTSTHALYVRTAVRTFFRQDRRHPRLQLQLPDGSTIDSLYMALVNNCDPWTFLGNRAISPTPGASFESGLDVYGRTRMGAVGILWSASQMIRPMAVEPDPTVLDLFEPDPAGESDVAETDPDARDSSGESAKGTSSRRGGRRGRLPGRLSTSRPPRQAPIDSHRNRLRGELVEHDLSDFTLSADRPMPFQVDGDSLEERTSVRFQGIPNAITVFV